MPTVKGGRRDDGAYHTHAGDVGGQTGVEVGNLGAPLGEAGPGLVGGDVVAVLEAVVDRFGDDLGWSRATPPAASCRATASMSNIEGSLPRGRRGRNRSRRPVESGRLPDNAAAVAESIFARRPANTGPTSRRRIPPWAWEIIAGASPCDFSASSSANDRGTRRIMGRMGRWAGGQVGRWAGGQGGQVSVRSCRYSALRQSGKHPSNSEPIRCGRPPCAGASTGAGCRQRQRPVGPLPCPYRLHRTLTWAATRRGRQSLPDGVGYIVGWSLLASA